jgi:hypothetical protein
MNVTQKQQNREHTKRNGSQAEIDIQVEDPPFCPHHPFLCYPDLRATVLTPGSLLKRKSVVRRGARSSPWSTGELCLMVLGEEDRTLCPNYRRR